MSLQNDKDVEQYLLSEGLLRRGDHFMAQPLNGGVSCRAWKVEIAEKTYVVKEALPQLNVQAEWLSDPQRIHREHEVMEYLVDLLPNGTIPKVSHKDYRNHVYIMDYVQHAQTWKDVLLEGDFSSKTCKDIARLLRTIHRNTQTATMGIKQQLGSQEYFIQLRINPFHRYVMEKHPLLAPSIQGLINELTEQPICLVHGDFSPKNILIDREEGITLIDFEVAHWGNPVFDLAFCTAHLLLKGWHLDHQEKAMDAVHNFLIAYDGDTPQLLPHLGLLLLARMDGKSPIHYITDEKLKNRIRKLSYEWIQCENKQDDTMLVMRNKYFAL